MTRSQLSFDLLPRRSIRHVRQTEIAECGLACLSMIFAFYKLRINLSGLREKFHVSSRGASFKDLVEISNDLGFNARPIKINIRDIRQIAFPAVLHWDMNHYVVAERSGRGGLLVHDPAGASQWLSLEEVSGHFTGVVLEIFPGENFEPRNEVVRLRMHQLWSSVEGLKGSALQIVLLTIILQTFVLTSPYYMQLAIDVALPSQNLGFLAVIGASFCIFSLLYAVASLLRSFVILAAGTTLGYGIAANITRRLFQLNVSWFSRRHVGDILSRFQSIQPIKKFLIEDAVSVLLDGILAAGTLILMMIYSLRLSMLALAALAAYGVLRMTVYSAQKLAQEEEIVLSGVEQTTLIESIRGIVTLRLHGSEASRHSLWQNRLVEALNASTQTSRLRAWQTAGSTFVVALENVVSIWLAVMLVMGGKFTIGMVFAYLAYKTQFLQKAMSLIDQVAAFQIMGVHLDRLADIALAKPDTRFSNKVPGRRDLTGNIELKNIDYRYSPSDPPVLQGVSLAIAAGDHVAITGPSGGGKSTLLSILLGLLEPDSGDVVVDGLELARFGYKQYQQQIGAVLQDDYLFAGTLGDNIALFDDRPDQKRIMFAAECAGILDDIGMMPMGLDSLVGDMGSALSGGQRQRVILARAIYRHPKVLILDEATSHLDESLEMRINGNLRALGITVVLVAHRKATIESADAVYELAGGALSQIR